MLALKYLLMVGGLGMILAALSILGYDLFREVVYRKALAVPGAALPPMPEWRWRTSLALGLLAWGPILLAFSIVVVPSGSAGVRVSQTSGTLPGTLYPGVHVVTPLVEDVALFDTRDQIFTTGMLEDGKDAAANVASKSQLLDVQAKEGLTLGLAITVRYRLDPKHLDYIQSNLPRPVEKEIVPPVVASVWRELVPNYTVRDVFSAKREEVRQRAATLITQKLAADGIVVKEVMLRDIRLPEEYAKGLETLLLKEQENDRMGVETELKQKQVKISELEAEATKVQQVKQALRLGLLDVGDQLPTVKAAVAQLAINPNTVLKAYRELEYEGLIESRPGQGTFVTRSLAGPSLASHVALRRELLAWIRRAQQADLDAESIEALFTNTFRDAVKPQEELA